MLGCLIVALPQLHADTRRGTHTYCSAKGCTQVHERHRDAQSGNGIGTHHLTYRGAVYDVVQRGGCHCHNSRQGILHQQFAHRFLSKL